MLTDLNAAALLQPPHVISRAPFHMFLPTAVGVAPNDQSTISGCLLQSYEDIGQAAFGSKGRAFITWVLYTELIGTCALFYILEVRAQEGRKDCSKLRRAGRSWRAAC